MYLLATAKCSLDLTQAHFKSGKFGCVASSPESELVAVKFLPPQFVKRPDPCTKRFGITNFFDRFVHDVPSLGTCLAKY